MINETLAWLSDPDNWTGTGGIARRSLEHLQYTGAVVVLALLIAVPLGWWIGHTRRFSGVVVGVSAAARALPTLGLITLFAVLMGIGVLPPLAALVILAVPSVLAGAFSGFDTVDPRVVDAARAQGFTTAQIVLRIEIPLGLPLLLAGIRTATLQVMSTATLAAYVGAGGLGRFVFLGLNTQQYAMMLGASVMVIALTLVIDLALAGVQRAVSPHGVRPARAAR
ncbi:MAG: ABC transporter permease [Micrococcaceae bacterium]